MTSGLADLEKRFFGGEKKLRDGVFVIIILTWSDRVFFLLDFEFFGKGEFLMRTARTKMRGRACYHHACARIAGAKDDYLFTDVDKEKGMKMVQDLARF